MILYLSCTGNTLWAARQLAAATGERLVSITDIKGNGTDFSLEEGERLGFCFPVHGWRPPKLLRNCIRSLHFLNPAGHFTYAVCTAGDNIGEAMDLLTNDLKNIGIKLDSAYSLIMPESYVGLPFMDVDKQCKEQQKIETSQSRLNEIITEVTHRNAGIFRLDRGNWPKVNSRIIGGFFTNCLITDKPFHVNSYQCVHCGTCGKVCPVGDISMTEGVIPKWNHNGRCLTCFSCYHHCPRHAIEYGGRTKGKGQYFFGIKH